MKNQLLIATLLTLLTSLEMCAQKVEQLYPCRDSLGNVIDGCIPMMNKETGQYTEVLPDSTWCANDVEYTQYVDIYDNSVVYVSQTSTECPDNFCDLLDGGSSTCSDCDMSIDQYNYGSMLLSAGLESNGDLEVKIIGATGSNDISVNVPIELNDSSGWYQSSHQMQSTGGVDPTPVTMTISNPSENNLVGFRYESESGMMLEYVTHIILSDDKVNKSVATIRPINLDAADCQNKLEYNKSSGGTQGYTATNMIVTLNGSQTGVDGQQENIDLSYAIHGVNTVTMSYDIKTPTQTVSGNYTSFQFYFNCPNATPGLDCDLCGYIDQECFSDIVCMKTYLNNDCSYLGDNNGLDYMYPFGYDTQFFGGFVKGFTGMPITAQTNDGDVNMIVYNMSQDKSLNGQMGSAETGTCDSEMVFFSNEYDSVDTIAKYLICVESTVRVDSVVILHNDIDSWPTDQEVEEVHYNNNQLHLPDSEYWACGNGSSQVVDDFTVLTANNQNQAYSTTFNSGNFCFGFGYKLSDSRSRGGSLTAITPHIKVYKWSKANLYKDCDSNPIYTDSECSYEIDADQIDCDSRLPMASPNFNYPYYR